MESRRVLEAKQTLTPLLYTIVRGKLAEVLSRFDLGDGGLVPLPFYKADLATPYGGDFFVLNFGARKTALLPDTSTSVAKFYVDKDTQEQVWKIQSWLHGDDAVVLSPAALHGPDLWFDDSGHIH